MPGLNDFITRNLKVSRAIVAALLLGACGPSDPASSTSEALDKAEAVAPARKHCLSLDSKNRLDICAEIETPGRYQARGWGSIMVKEGGVPRNATDCKLTTTLYLTNETSQWETSRTERCADVIHVQPKLFMMYHETGTTAIYAQARACVDWYFKGSDDSGWQECVLSPIADVRH
jgi:hypothetical protein